MVFVSDRALMGRRDHQVSQDSEELWAYLESEERAGWLGPPVLLYVWNSSSHSPFISIALRVVSLYTEQSPNPRQSDIQDAHTLSICVLTSDVTLIFPGCTRKIRCPRNSGRQGCCRCSRVTRDNRTKRGPWSYGMCFHLIDP